MAERLLAEKHKPEIRSQLDRILASPSFETTARTRSFLAYSNDVDPEDAHAGEPQLIAAAIYAEAGLTALRRQGARLADGPCPGHRRQNPTREVAIRYLRREDQERFLRSYRKA
jgi:hypothetical protein